MKVYTFLDEDGSILEEVRAEDHSDAVSKANAWHDNGIDASTDFYSTEVSND